MPHSPTTDRRTWIAIAAAGLAAPRAVAENEGAAREAPTEKIRIGQIGTKHAHAAGKIAALRSLRDDYEVVGVAEPDSARRDAVRRQPSYRGLAWMSVEQLLEVPGLQAVAVETDVNSLVPTALTCVNAGLHVHLDKPAGPSMSRCRELHEAANRSGVTLQMGYMLRYNPAFQLLFQAVREGWLGRITEISTEMGKRADDKLRQELAQYPGGGMFELSCHVIDAVVHLLGKPDRVKAHNRKTYPDKDQFVDNQLAVLDYPDALATVRCNHLDPFGFPRRHFEVVGERGTLRIGPLEPPRVRLSLDRPRDRFAKGSQEIDFPKASGRYDDEFRDLAAVIRGEKELAWDSAHDLAVHETVLRCSGMPID